MTIRSLAMLTFSVSSYSNLMMLECEFRCHEDVITGSSFDGESFILAVECPNTAAIVWDVRITVLTFDPEATICRQASPPGGTYDRPAA